MSFTWVDGVAADTVPADDRGLNYADGAFETLSCHEGRIELKDLHQNRLTRALIALHIRDAAEQSAHLFADAGRCIEAARHTGIARLTVTRGSGPRGYAPPESPQLRSILRAYPGPVSSYSELRCGIAATRWAAQPQLAGLKLLARTEQVLAAAEAASDGWDDMVMLDSDDHVISSSRGNLFMLFGEKIVTPCLDVCGIAGTRRELLTKILPTMIAPLVRPILWRNVCPQTLDHDHSVSGSLRSRSWNLAELACWQRVGRHYNGHGAFHDQRVVLAALLLSAVVIGPHAASDPSGINLRSPGGSPYYCWGDSWVRWRGQSRTVVNPEQLGGCRRSMAGFG